MWYLTVRYLIISVSIYEWKEKNKYSYSYCAHGMSPRRFMVKTGLWLMILEEKIILNLGIDYFKAFGILRNEPFFPNSLGTKGC